MDGILGYVFGVIGYLLIGAFVIRVMYRFSPPPEDPTKTDFDRKIEAFGYVLLWPLMAAIFLVIFIAWVIAGIVVTKR